jgi:hypothetical protein
VRHSSRSDDLLLLEAGRDRIFQFGLKIGGCAITAGARDIIVKVALRGS